MSPLPLILEQTARWYFFAVPVSGLLIFLAGGGVLAMKRRDWQGASPGAVAAIAALLLVALEFAALPLGWQLRVDREGVTLRAPVEFWTHSGTIAWHDLRQVRFGSTMSTSSGSFPTLQFVGRNGRVLELKALNAVPEGWWAALVAAIDANAPLLDLPPDREGWLKHAREIARHDDPERAMIGYVAHDGTGRQLP